MLTSHTLAAAGTLLLPLALSGCAAPAETGADPSPASLHDALTALAERHHVCAVAVAVVRQRKLEAIDTATGCQPAVAVDADSVFQAASLSKPVFAYAVLKLAGQGRLDLDTPIMHYLPQGYRHRFDPLKAEPSELVTDARLEAITVRMALDHSSGLPNWAGGPLRVDTVPGTAWEYSGEGYLLLQRAVEAVTGQPLDRFMRAQVFGPLGMHSSDFVFNAALAGRLLPGTKANGAPRATMRLAEPVAAFTLHTSAADYAKFLAAVLGDAALLAQSTGAPVPVDSALGLEWGLGWGIAREGTQSYLWQWGNNTGYRAFAMAGVASGDGFVMLTNSENGLALAQPLAQRLLPGEHRLFRSAILGTDIVTLACRSLRLCF